MSQTQTWSPVTGPPVPYEASRKPGSVSNNRSKQIQSFAVYTWVESEFHLLSYLRFGPFGKCRKFRTWKLCERVEVQPVNCEAETVRHE